TNIINQHHRIHQPWFPTPKTKHSLAETCTRAADSSAGFSLCHRLATGQIWANDVATCTPTSTGWFSSRTSAQRWITFVKKLRPGPSSSTSIVSSLNEAPCWP
ncbi:hypothetical protein BKA56DRAFT_735413, partial [Ilyonectria sp. MPI-CAGE-AT-0026]